MPIVEVIKDFLGPHGMVKVGEIRSVSEATAQSWYRQQFAKPAGLHTQRSRKEIQDKMVRPTNTPTVTTRTASDSATWQTREQIEKQEKAEKLKEEESKESEKQEE
jgi:hypothetical protein